MTSPVLSLGAEDGVPNTGSATRSNRDHRAVRGVMGAFGQEPQLSRHEWRPSDLTRTLRGCLGESRRLRVPDGVNVPKREFWGLRCPGGTQRVLRDCKGLDVGCRGRKGPDRQVNRCTTNRKQSTLHSRACKMTHATTNFLFRCR